MREIFGDQKFCGLLKNSSVIKFRGKTFRGILKNLKESELFNFEHAKVKFKF